MLITATKYVTRIQYRKPGKFYNQASQESGNALVNTDERSDYPFDETDIAVGESFDATGLDVVAIREFTPVNAPAETVVAD